MTTEKISRRALGGLAAAGVPLLAACGGSHSETAAPAGGGSGNGGSELASTSDIEVGGGSIFPDAEVVVTQPSKGQFKCFTAICTHQGCLVSQVSDGTINCDCHGSQYSIEDGSVVQGPATSPLAEEKIAVAGGSISLA
jgi:Rieske Fe-S protein